MLKRTFQRLKEVFGNTLGFIVLLVIIFGLIWLLATGAIIGVYIQILGSLAIYHMFGFWPVVQFWLTILVLAIFLWYLNKNKSGMNSFLLPFALLIAVFLSGMPS